MTQTTLHCGECLEVMDLIQRDSVDMVLCDLPYGTTKNKWDVVIPLRQMWDAYARILKRQGIIVLFGSQPFTSDLIQSNKEMFKYELIWNKMYGKDFQNANRRPMKSHENVLIFYRDTPIYSPQMTPRAKPIDNRKWKDDKKASVNHKSFSCKDVTKKIYEAKYPVSVIEINGADKECNNTKRVHPTQKPVALMEYLIKTYTNEGDTVLDNCMGSGSTGVAAKRLNRNFIGIELDQKYFDIAKQRIEETHV